MERKGICRNVGPCSKANKIQIITDDDAPFTCPECESELEPVSEQAIDDDKEDLKKKKWKKLITLSIFIIILLAIIGAFYALSGNPDVEGLSFDKVNITLKIGQTERINVIVEPEEVKPELIWKSSDEGVVSVIDGVISAKAVGKATVSVVVNENEDVSAVCECTVIGEDVNMETLDIQEDPVVLRPGGHQQLTVKFTPEDQTETITWTSTDETIAKVSQRGKVEAIEVGQVLIIAKSDRTGVADTATVSVEGPAEMPEEKSPETKEPATKATSTPAPPKSVAPSTPKPVTSGSKNLGYATFKGSWPNDVNGRMVFTSSHIIDSKDPKKRVAEAGDYVIGEWSEGHLVQGIWYGSDNQVKGSVIIGK